MPEDAGRHRLLRRLLAESIGTALLVAGVIGSGIAAARLSPGNLGLELFENAAATTAVLAAVIVAVGPVSGAHLNPVVTLVDRWFGGITTTAACGYVCAQVAGGVVGAIVANAMFSRAALELSTKTRSGGGIWLAEVVATFGLLLVVFGATRSGRPGIAPFAVGAYIGGAYFFTSSTSFANPAVAVARMFSNTFAGIKPASVPGFLLAEAGGALLAVAAISVLFPRAAEIAEDVVLPHPSTAEEVPMADRPDARPEVLFVCVHNAGRSQMAAALLDHRARGRVQVRSAGSAPAVEVNPAVVAVMGEMGLDLSGAVPTHLTPELAREADVVVTMGCGDACPVYPGKRYLDWEIEDPAGKGVEEVRVIRDEIERRVDRLLAELGVEAEDPAPAQG